MDSEFWAAWPEETDPDWLSELPNVFSGTAIASFDPHDYGGLVAALLDAYRARLLQALAGPDSIAPPNEQLTNSLLAHLEDRLVSVVVRAIVLEENISSAQGALSGASPERRHKYFLRMLVDEKYRRQFAATYPGLARHCRRECEQWLAATVEFWRRLESDRPSLVGCFGAFAASPACDAIVTESDPHNGGRRAIIVDFGGGKLVYKPRPLSADQTFQHLVSWLNGCGFGPALRTVVILERQQYGWMEYVAEEACASEAEVRAFYVRLGAILALLYVLCGTDCHLENLIASGAHPVPIDLETLFSPRIGGGQTVGAEAAALDALAQSVLATGLLPNPSLIGGTIVDLSAIGAAPSQPTHIQTLGLVNAGTDEARIAPVPYVIENSAHLPVLDSVTIAHHAFAAEIEQGFTSAYTMVSANRESIFSGLPVSLEQVRNSDIRILLRPTAYYAKLLEDGFHPSVLTDETERQRVLASVWAGSDSDEQRRLAAGAEFDQLCRGDVPRFQTTAGARSCGCGEVELPFQESGIERVLGRLKNLNADDLEFQRWVVSTAVGSRYAPLHVQDEATSIGMARAIGSAFERTAFRGAGRATWLHREFIGAEAAYSRASPALVSGDLYGGTSGIALFLGHLGALLDLPSMSELARHALHSAAESGFGGLGAFHGISGLAYVYSQLGALWNDGVLLNRAADLVERIGQDSERCESIDLISGQSGTILCLLAVHQNTNDKRALRLAELIGSRLIDTFRGDLLPYQRGASHGMSGVALAVTRLAAASSGAAFGNAAMRLRAMERALTQGGAWWDEDDHLHTNQSTWCHGPAGIALCRVGMAQHLATDLADTRLSVLESVVAMRGLLDAPRGNLGLCHGTSGVAEVFLSLASEMDFGESLLGATGSQCDWRRECRDDPSLMTGVAGFGYSLLRYLFKGRVPNVLLLDSAAR